MLKRLTFTLIMCCSFTFSAQAQDLSAGTVGGSILSEITMQVITATCKPATINNVNFGNVDRNTFIKGSLSLTSILQLDCSGSVKPQHVSLMFVPQHPDSVDSANGYIKSTNTSLGYQLLWNDNLVGTLGKGIPMNSEQFIKNPTASLMKINLKIKPVILPKGSSILNLGDANTSLTIKIKYS